MKKQAAVVIATILIGIMGSSVVTSAQTRSFTFHMSTQYAHGHTPNYGYSATKADNEQRAYVTVTSFQRTSGSPRVSMYVGKPTRQVSTAWTWSGTGSKRLNYTINAKKDNSYCICAEQFGTGKVVVAGQWTP